MSTMYGADVAQLRDLAKQFDSAASRLDDDRMAVGSAIQVSAWVGPVAVRFRAQWESDHSRRLHAAAERLRSAALALRANADDQERTSAVDGSAARGVSSGNGRTDRLNDGAPEGGWPALFEYLLRDVLIDGAQYVSHRVDLSGSVVELLTGHDVDLWDALPHGSYMSSALKGIGLGDAASRFAEAVSQRDWSGAMLAGADGAFGFTPSPVSLLWDGSKEMTGFYIPLDQAARDEHMAWMEQRGYTPSDLADRYTGGQGFINLGNDNVERKAPWLNRAAEAVLQGPAEWLYNVGIRL